MKNCVSVRESNSMNIFKQTCQWDFFQGQIYLLKDQNLFIYSAAPGA